MKLTVKQLIQELEKYDQDLIVYRDYEGCYRDIVPQEFEITNKGLQISIDY